MHIATVRHLAGLLVPSGNSSIFKVLEAGYRYKTARVDGVVLLYHCYYIIVNLTLRHVKYTLRTQPCLRHVFTSAQQTCRPAV